MSIKKFVDDNRLDAKAIARIRRRVMIVGRFNQENPGRPTVSLFVKDPSKVDPEYRRNFDGSPERLDYDGFVRSLRPAISERMIRNRERFPAFELQVPANKAELQSAFIIDRFNYFFDRAASTSEQQFFKRRDRQTKAGQNYYPESEADAGRSILSGIQSSLHTYCQFQSRVSEVVDAMARLLSKCSGQLGMPTYAHGAPLPEGFASRLMDFLFSDDSSAGFKAQLEGMNPTPGSEYFAELFDRGPGGEAARTMFSSVVGSFRDMLLGLEDSPDGQKPFNPSTLRELCRDVLKEQLCEDFARAREAYNGLRQILRSRVLLATVLQWVLDSFNEIPDMKALTLDTDEHIRNETLVKAITDRASKNGLRAPVQRPSIDERATFRRELTNGFEDVVKYILDGPGSASHELPCELLAVAQKLAEDESAVSLLRLVAGAGTDDKAKKAFVTASKMVIVDVMLPVLFKTPVLTAQDLLRELQSGLMSGYLAAIFLSPKNQEGFRQIAVDSYDKFAKSIENGRLKKQESIKVQADLLGQMFKLLASKELQEDLVQGITTIHEMSVIFEQVRAGTLDLGLGNWLALRPGRHGKGQGLKATKPSIADVQKIAQAVVVQAIANKQAASASQRATSTQGGAAAGAPAVAGERGTLTAEASGEGAPVAPPSASATESPASTKSDDIVARVLLVIPEPEVEGESSGEEARSRYETQAVEAVAADKDFVSHVGGLIERFQSAVALIYETYRENPSAREYGSVVEKFSLANMMLLFKDDLALGKVGSNLYRMLLDLVRYVNPDTTDLREFRREHSLTEYFDSQDLNVEGIGALRKQLDNQGSNSLKNIVQFVSELRGVDYLLAQVGTLSDVEVIVVNADADEFLDWLHGDNLAEGAGSGAGPAGRMLANRITPELSRKIITPGLIVMTDIAFRTSGPAAWIAKLQNYSLTNNQAAMVLPPIVISTSAARAKDAKGGHDAGESMGNAAASAHAPVLVVGPSPRLNGREDGFATFIPAAYTIGAHFLSQSDQGLMTEQTTRASTGRYQVLAQGDLRPVLERIFMLTGAPHYALAGDYFLFICGLLLAGAKKRAGAGGDIHGEELLGSLQGDTETASFFTKLKQGNDPAALDLMKQFFWAGRHARFALGQELGSSDGAQLQHIWAGDGQDLFDSGRATGPCKMINDVAWFRALLEELGLVNA